jgi:hypothetical protein
MNFNGFCVNQFTRQVINVIMRQNAFIQCVRRMPNQTIQHRCVYINRQDRCPSESDYFLVVLISSFNLNTQLEHELKNVLFAIFTRDLDEVVVELLAPETAGY